MGEKRGHLPKPIELFLICKPRITLINDVCAFPLCCAHSVWSVGLLSKYESEFQSHHYDVKFNKMSWQFRFSYQFKFWSSSEYELLDTHQLTTHRLVSTPLLVWITVVGFGLVFNSSQDGYDWFGVHRIYHVHWFGDWSIHNGHQWMGDRRRPTNMYDLLQHLLWPREEDGWIVLRIWEGYLGLHLR